LSSEQQFNELMRNLRYLLQTDFNELFRLQSSWKLFNKQISNLQQLAIGTEGAFNSGNISAKENLRVKALLYSAQSDRVDMERQMADVQREMHILLQLQADTVLAPSTGDVSIVTNQHLSLQALIDTARHNRPDLQLMQTNLHIQQHNLSYQRALAKPDLNVGLEYDKASNYIPNYWGLTISLPVPVFNRNKGNIRAAEISVQQAGQMELQAAVRAEQEVTAAYNKYIALATLLKQAAPVLDQEYERMLQNITNSYQQRQIGLLEFIDFIGSYREIKLKKIQQAADLRNAVAELNFSTGQNIIQ
jgi:cobalt-zinc-cadmium efflux system outer membrane protein